MSAGVTSSSVKKVIGYSVAWDAKDGLSVNLREVCMR